MSNGPWWSKWKSQRWPKKKTGVNCDVVGGLLYYFFSEMFAVIAREEELQPEEVVMSRVCALIRDNKLMAINLFSIWDLSSVSAIESSRIESGCLFPF